MKGNNGCFLFKSVALLCLLLGDLSHDVLCGSPSSTKSAKVKIGEISVDKKEICNIINKLYAIKGTSNYSELIGGKPDEFVFYTLNTVDDVNCLLRCFISMSWTDVFFSSAYPKFVTAKSLFDALN